MDACGSERSFLIGMTIGASLACLFAATYPERSLGLALIQAQSRSAWSPETPWGETRRTIPRAERADRRRMGYRRRSSDGSCEGGLGARRRPGRSSSERRSTCATAWAPASRHGRTRPGSRPTSPTSCPSVHVPTLVIESRRRARGHTRPRRSSPARRAGPDPRAVHPAMDPRDGAGRRGDRAVRRGPPGAGGRARAGPRHSALPSARAPPRPRR